MAEKLGKRYTKEMKQAILQRMMPPNNEKISAISEEVKVTEAILYKCRKEARENLDKHRYGGKDDWRKHFEYLLPYFLDKNYITNDGKPFLDIYRPELIECLNDMLDYWNELAIQYGFKGIDFAYQQLSFFNMKDKDDSRYKHNIEFQFGYARYDLQNNQENKCNGI